MDTKRNEADAEEASSERHEYDGGDCEKETRRKRHETHTRRESETENETREEKEKQEERDARRPQQPRTPSAVPSARVTNTDDGAVIESGYVRSVDGGWELEEMENKKSEKRRKEKRERL